MNSWGQKKTSKDGAEGRSADSDKQLSAEFKKKLDEWQKMKRMDEAPVPADENVLSERQSQDSEFLMSDFKRKIDPWHRPKDKGKEILATLIPSQFKL